MVKLEHSPGYSAFPPITIWIVLILLLIQNQLIELHHYSSNQHKAEYWQSEGQSVSHSYQLS